MTVSEDVLALMNRQIDDAIQNIPVITTVFRNEDIDWKLMKITTESDFILGAVWGQVLAMFSVLFNQVSRAYDITLRS